MARRQMRGALAREALTVPETLGADDLLAEMRRRRVREAIVIDEYGGTAGIVTFEALMERIVGEIGGEFGASARIVVRPDGSADIDGLTLVGDVNAQFGLHIDEGGVYDRRRIRPRAARPPRPRRRHHRDRRPADARRCSSTACGSRSVLAVDPSRRRATCRKSARSQRPWHTPGHGHDHPEHAHSARAWRTRTRRPACSGRTMGLAVVLTLVFVALEAHRAAGSVTASRCSPTPGHNLADAAALGLSWYALWIAHKPSHHGMTFGYHRVGVLAALVNGVSLVVIALLIGWEAVDRIRYPEPLMAA